MVAKEAQVARGDGVHHQEEHVRGPRGRHWPRTRPRLFDAVADPDCCGEAHHNSCGDGESHSHKFSEGPSAALEERHEPRRHPEGHDNEGQSVDPRKSDKQQGQDRHCAKARLTSQRPRCRASTMIAHPSNPRARNMPKFTTGISQTK